MIKKQNKNYKTPLKNLFYTVFFCSYTELSLIFVSHFVSTLYYCYMHLKNLTKLQDYSLMYDEKPLKTV